jgi:hypothetical protein
MAEGMMAYFFVDNIEKRWLLVQLYSCSFTEGYFQKPCQVEPVETNSRFFIFQNDFDKLSLTHN